MTSEKDHLAAVVELLGGFAGGAYSVGDLKKLKQLPTKYNEVHVMERLGDGPRRTSRPAQTQQWRILVRAIATEFANAQEMRRLASQLHESPLVVTGETFYVERAQSDDPIASDDGWWSGTSEFIY